MPWYAVQHKRSQGDRALANLQNQNIQCLHPKVAVERIIAGKPTTRMESLFPSYIFICIDPSDPCWGKLRSTRGLLRVVSFGGRAGLIPDEVIDYINDSLKTIESHGGLKQGEQIQIQKGPFRSLEGIFQAYDGEERAIVLISLMQSQHRVKVRLGDL